MTKRSHQHKFEDEGLTPAEKYEQLGIADALSRPYDYCSACQELALILRRAYAKLPKNVQSLIFRDTLSAFHLLPKIEPSIGVPAASFLVQAAEVALPKQKKTLASTEFKHVMVAQKRRGKAHEHEVCFQGSMHLPEDILLHIFRLLDMRSLVRASSVCWAWNAAAKDNILWMSQYSLVFGKFDISHKKKSHYCDYVDDISDAVALKEGKDLSAYIDWREAFKRKFFGRSAWRSRPHRAVCVHCESIIWLSGITCNMHHRCPKNEQESLKIRPISSDTLIDYLLGKFKCDCCGKNFDLSSSESDDSDNDGSPTPNWQLPKLWALPRLIEDL